MEYQYVLLLCQVKMVFVRAKPYNAELVPDTSNLSDIITESPWTANPRL